MAYDPLQKEVYALMKFDELSLAKPITASIKSDSRFNSSIPVSYFKESVKYWDFDKDGYLDMSFVIIDTIVNNYSLIICPYSDGKCNIIGFNEMDIDSLIEWQTNESKNRLFLTKYDSSKFEISWNEKSRFFDIKASNK